MLGDLKYRKLLRNLLFRNSLIMNIKKTFGEKIKRLRKMKNLTQEQLAESTNTLLWYYVKF